MVGSVSQRLRGKRVPSQAMTDCATMRGVAMNTARVRAQAFGQRPSLGSLLHGEQQGVLSKRSGNVRL